MYNNIEQCWFYRMCRKSCSKDIGLIFVGVLLVIAAVVLLRWVIGTFQLFLVIAGIYFIVRGLAVFFKRMPNVKGFLLSMPPEWLATLGEQPPQPWYGELYMTQYYLCIPGEYIMVRYSDITDISVVKNLNRGRTSSYTLKFTIAGRKDSLDIVVTDWRSFEETRNNFFGALEERKAAMLQMIQQQQ